MQIINQTVRENDKVKEDNALAHPSDQLLVLTERKYTTIPTIGKKTNDII